MTTLHAELYEALMSVGAEKEIARAAATGLPSPEHLVSKADFKVGITAVHGRLDKIDGRLDRMDGRLDRMDDRQDRMEGCIGKVKDRQLTSAGLIMGTIGIATTVILYSL